jgi:hypothetical protein
MTLIANFFGKDVQSLGPSSSKRSTFRVRTNNIAANQLLISYLDRFPLFGTKYLDYLDWVKAFSIYVEGYHYSEHGINEIVKIKSHMNDKRTIFIWDHLNNFYSL